MAKRKTTSNEVKQRWESAACRKYLVRLRVDDDADLIRWIEPHKADTGTTELFRLGLEKRKNKSK